MKKLVQDPTLHFVLLGVLIFAVWSVWGEPQPAEDASQRTIVISEDQVAELRRDYTLRTGQPPSPTVQDGLVEDWVKEEVLFREALSLGLHKTDEIVRRRLIQVMGFLLEDMSPIPEPEPGALRTWYREHEDQYAAPLRLSFDHVFFSEEVDGGRVQPALEALKGGSGSDGMGDPFISGLRFNARSPRQIASIFGHSFSAAIQKLPLETWSGPVSSALGTHLVYVRSVTPGGPRPFEDVQERVLNDWRAAQRDLADAAAEKQLLERYEIRRGE